MAPPGVGDLGELAWAPRGVKVLGTPLGCASFVEECIRKRERDEETVLEGVVRMPDLQCAWQMLTKCCSPRANYLLRTLPPSESASYAVRHDERLWRAAVQLLRAEDLNRAARDTGRLIANLPMRMGGLGLRSAKRTAPQHTGRRGQTLCP